MTICISEVFSLLGGEVKARSSLTFLILLMIFPSGVFARESVSEADFASLEAEYAAAKQEFATEVKNRKDIKPSELQALREKIVGPKKQALDEAYNKRANARRIDPKEMGVENPRDRPSTHQSPPITRENSREDPSVALPNADIPSEIHYGNKTEAPTAEPGSSEGTEPSPSPLGAGVSEIRYPKAKPLKKSAP